MTAETGQNVTQEMGLQFCSFTMKKKLGSGGEYDIKHIPKSRVESASIYGLMLPYKLQKYTFQQQ